MNDKKDIAMQVELALRKAVEKEKDFRGYAGMFENLAKRFVQEEKREKFLKELNDIFRN
jgi:hypothetical protein